MYVEYCVCGHILEVHTPYCDVCMDFRDEYIDEAIQKASHTFKLDNLRYIEDLAKLRNLI